MAYEPAPLPPEADRCDACGGRGWREAEPGAGDWQECRQCQGTGSRDQHGRKQPMPETPDSEQ